MASGPTSSPLVVLVRDRAGRTRREAFLRSPVRVGRDPASDLVLAEAQISARHGLLEFDAAGVRYTDLGSRNGSALHGSQGARTLPPHAPAEVAAGEEVELGPLRLGFERAARPQPASQPASQPGCPPASEAIRPGAITAMLEALARAPSVTPTDAWAASLHPGLRVGRFELVRELGRGGCGIVYEARDRQLGRRVALKAVRPGGALDGAGGGDGLLREAEAAAQLGHPNIVQLHDAGTWEGGPYLIYELLSGASLAERLVRGPLPPAEALRVAIDVARALAHAHGAGVVHRDLKPSNVFLAEDGWVKVLDFGLAHVLGAGGIDGGTLRYMAPEQARRAAPDARADVFSAAIVLRETWLGPGLDDAACRAPDAPPGAPAGLGALLGRALAEDPARRPEDGRAWLESLLAVAPDAVRVTK